MSVIFMTALFYKALILQGEIACCSPLGLKGLKGICHATSYFFEKLKFVLKLRVTTVFILRIWMLCIFYHALSTKD